MARNQNSIGDRNGEKNLGRNQAQLGGSSPLARQNQHSVVSRLQNKSDLAEDLSGSRGPVLMAV